MGNDIDDLFKNPWCPLFGHLPEVEDNTPNTPIKRCIDIITEARSLWGINPFFHVTDTSWPEAEDLPPEKPPEISPLIHPEYSPKECSKYPEWKLKAARTIARTCYSVQKYLYRYSTYGHNATPDISWTEAIHIIRSESIPRLDQRVTDSMILGILSIETAWETLGDILYYRENDVSNLLNQEQIAKNLLTNAREIIFETVIKAQGETIKDHKRIIDRTKPCGIFRQHKEHWVLSYAEKTIRVKIKGNKGLGDIHYLLHYPGKDVSASEILLKERLKISDLKENPLIDKKGIEVLKEHLNRLKDEYEAAKINGDLETIEEKEDKIVKIESTLKEAKGKGRNPRQFINDAEKHRKNVWKHIAHSLKVLKEKHPPLFDHLSKTITTGNECSYKPGNDPLLQCENPNWTL